MAGSKFIGTLLLSSAAMTMGMDAMAQAAPTAAKAAEPAKPSLIEFTARDTLALSFEEVAPLTVGLGSKGIELYAANRMASGLKLDAGVLSISSPPGTLSIGSKITDLHAKVQSYDSNFLGVSAEKSLSDTTSAMGYAGKDLDGGYVAGARYINQFSSEAKLILDAHTTRGMNSTGAYIDWSRDGDISHHAQAGISIRNGTPVASGTYTASKKFTIEGHGYLRAQFAASASIDNRGSETSVSMGVMKDVASFNLGGIPATMEVGVGVQKNSGDRARPIAMWNLKIP